MIRLRMLVGRSIPRDKAEAMEVKAEKVAILSGILVIIILGCLVLYQADVIGVSQGRLEQAAREDQKIDDTWKMTQAVNDDMCAMLFYDDDKDEYVYSVYLARDKFSYGYFFREGGQNPYIQEGVQGVIYEDKGIALMSLNENQVARIVVENGTEEENIAVDPKTPFTIVLPLESNTITMYDAAGNVVTLYDTFKG